MKSEYTVEAVVSKRNKETGEKTFTRQTWTVELEFDLQKIVREIGGKAIRQRSGKSRMLGGLIKARRRKMLKLEAV